MLDKAMSALKLGDVLLTNLVNENKKLKEQREMLLSLVKNYLKYEIFELQDQGFSKEEILDLSILEPYFKAIKEVEGEDYYP